MLPRRVRRAAAAVGRADRGSLRIVGGRWRGRRLPVPDQPGLRPTTDRIRETLFNWVAPWVEGSRCLDCFAGSGALGFEAASRGAREVMMLEHSAAAVRVLADSVATLDAEQVVSVRRTEALEWLATAPVEPFDLCFLDPPFGSGLLAPAVTELVSRGWLATNALVYLECNKSSSLPQLPEPCEWLREKQSGQVRYGLARAS